MWQRWSHQAVRISHWCNQGAAESMMRTLPFTFVSTWCIIVFGCFFAFATRTSHEYGTRWTGKFSYTSDIRASYYKFSLGAVISTWIAGTAMFQHVMDHDLGDAWRCSELIFGGNMFRSGKEMKELLIQGEFLGIVLNVTFFVVVFVCLIFDYCFYLHMKH